MTLPLKELTPEIKKRGASRALNFGPPDSFKTTAAVGTAPYPLHIVSPPGEEGWNTIPDPATLPGLKAYVWEESPGDPVTAESMRKEVEDTVYQIIGGKKGPCRTLVIDGFHKQYDMYLNVASASAYGRGEEFDAIRYGRAHQMAKSFLRKVLASPIEYVIVTTWNAKELDRPLKPGETLRSSGVESHEWPDLPGKMAKLIVGSFSLVVFSAVKSVAPAKPGDPRGLVGEWLIKPDVEIWGSHVKMDPRLIGKLPAKVPQNWRALFKLVGAAEAELEQEGGMSENSGGA